jgi:O-antigen ligase
MSEVIRSISSTGSRVFGTSEIWTRSLTAGAVLFYSVLAVIGLAAIPYGAAEPWWKAALQCAIFLIAGVTVAQKTITIEHLKRDWRIFVPAASLIGYALIQTIPGRQSGVTISADVFQTRLFVLQLAALLILGWLLVQHLERRKRLFQLIDVIIGIGFFSACFGLLRQLTQHQRGFFLPNLEAGFGYGQFINPNHFAFLMEMTLGLALGICAARGVAGNRFKIYLIAAVPMWLALVLSNSRAGIVSILFQVLFLSLAFFHNHVQPIAQKTTQSVATAYFLRAVLAITMLGAAMIAVAYVGGGPLSRKIDGVHSELNDETARTFALRQNIWSSTWQLIKDHPITGVGFGGFWIAITKYHQASGEITPQQAHNDYLELVASGGLIGVAIAAWFLVEVTRRARQRMRNRDRLSRAVSWGATAGILTISIHSVGDFGLHIPINSVVFCALVTLTIVDVRLENV